ncbi:SAM-dependent chlorinase/fluorinase [Candidatus Woesearchaeota archaeon]|nr:SAM-dependent chlorinase/fluorinase [Candidatus Woesearchaeota archaeon]
MDKPIITFTTDFAVQSHEIGIMESVVLEINPKAHVIHLMHGLPDFNLSYAARVMETACYIPNGYHVCVVDPGVGTKRKPIIIETVKGNFLIGPDNGVLIPATRFLGGIKKAVEITNKKYMKHPVSNIFHGRDIFAPAAAYLSKKIKIGSFGRNLDIKELAKAPYEEAEIKNSKIDAKIISINKFGSFHINVAHKIWDKFDVRLGTMVSLSFNGQSLNVAYAKTFGDVEKGKPLIMKDEFGRVEVALNQDSFAGKYQIKIGDNILIRRLLK